MINKDNIRLNWKNFRRALYFIQGILIFLIVILYSKKMIIDNGLTLLMMGWILVGLSLFLGESIFIKSKKTKLNK